MSTPQPSASVKQAVESVAVQYGVPDGIWEDVAYVESGYDVRATGDNGTSFGLFQLHAGGQLGNLTPDQAYDPATNARAAMPSIAAAWTKLKGSFGDGNSNAWWLQFASISGHPAENGNTQDPAVVAEAQKLQAAYNGNPIIGAVNGIVAGATGVNVASSIVDPITSAIANLQSFTANISWLQQNWQNGLIKIGIFVFALLLIGFGLFVVVRKNQ